jgi:nucleoside-diphosphate kinase
LLKGHYSPLADKPFFPEIAGFMKSAPVVAMILEGQDVIAKVRDMVGPTDSTKAPKGTIRGDLGKTKMENIVHASDTPENAAAEVKRFFKQEEIF